MHNLIHKRRLAQLDNTRHDAIPLYGKVWEKQRNHSTIIIVDLDFLGSISITDRRR